MLTGSRAWDDTAVIEHALAMILARNPGGVLLVHGACPRGADAIAVAYAARTSRYQIEPHPADWHRYGLAVGQHGDDRTRRRRVRRVLARRQPGTRATIRLARSAGIPVWLHTQQ
jgi:hypothetical protein